jgi:hypothetical protein
VRLLGFLKYDRHMSLLPQGGNYGGARERLRPQFLGKIRTLDKREGGGGSEREREREVIRNGTAYRQHVHVHSDQ